MAFPYPGVVSTVTAPFNYASSHLEPPPPSSWAANPVVRKTDATAVVRASTMAAGVTVRSSVIATLAFRAVNGSLVIRSLSCSATVKASTMGSSVAIASASQAAVTESAVQESDITLSEFNDVSIALAVTQNGSPLNLTGYTVQMLLKPVRGEADNGSGVITLSSAGGSPAITITNASGGLATVNIPHSDLQGTAFTFYRVDVVDVSGNITTVVFGTVTYVQL